MTVASEMAWAYAHAYDRSRTHNKDGDCPFCREEATTGGKK